MSPLKKGTNAAEGVRINQLCIDQAFLCADQAFLYAAMPFLYVTMPFLYATMPFLYAAMPFLYTECFRSCSRIAQYSTR